MLEKLKDAEHRYGEMERELSSAEIFSDPGRYAALMKEYKALTPIIEKCINIDPNARFSNVRELHEKL